MAPSPDQQIEEQAKALLAQMTLDEKIHQMSGDGSLLTDGLKQLYAYNTRPIPAGGSPRLDIPGIHFSDGPRGIVMYHSTCFPVSMARGASWDVGLEERIGDAIGVEARSQGANFFGGVCINLLRHPAWGRAQETYGEDPYHLGEMGAALVRGVQRHIMACAKHYALNSIENARFKVDVQADERTLRELYLPHFKRCVDEGVAAIMGAYNKFRGEYCGHHAYLLRKILKEDWGFDGFVISDFVYGVRDGKAAALGGLDIEMPFTQHYGKRLKRLVERGQVPASVIDEAVLRILRQQIRFTHIGEPERYRKATVAGKAHQALAREAAQKSMVLLKNSPVPGTEKPILPIDWTKFQQIALIGKLAALPNTGDKGSSDVRPPHVITPLQALQEIVGNRLVFDDGQPISGAAAVAKQADVAIVVVGYTHHDEGEYIKFFWYSKGGDRDRLALSQHDEALIQAVVAANPKTVVVMVGGSAIITEAWRGRVPAILMAWYAGMEGGRALADILFGVVSPSGKLPCVFPKSEAQLPFFDKDADSIQYGADHGYRLVDRLGEEPAFPFGFGLSYTTFAYHDLDLEQDAIDRDGQQRISISITNTGRVAGADVAQLYVGCAGSSVSRAVRELKGFARVGLEPGETRRVTFELPARCLAYYDVAQSAWIVEPMEVQVYVGPSSARSDLLQGQFRIRP